MTRKQHPATGVERLIDAARAHGELSEPDHEVGDLQEILRVCWQQLNVFQQTAVLANFASLVDDWGGDP
jgi:hypothetical protein